MPAEVRATRYRVPRITSRLKLLAPAAEVVAVTASPPPPQTTGGPLRCRQCGARLTPGVEWCSLCLTPTAVAAVIEDEVRGGPEGAAPGEVPPAAGEVVWPSERRKGRHVRDPGPGEEPAELVAGLARDESANRPAVAVMKAHLALGQLPGGKYAIAFGGGLLLLVLLMAGLTVLGLLV
ncbi:hypothetical protein GCM10022223_49190 [Kineosporia mesophila]|uniref:Zinc ribbon domain-containing protein n=1 Tax=Kineosporia mesophila TaxID=566012 RepID=A0ABP7A707_9ACTN|nr:hypothetical protein [Kineosporia mesophila]MCD5351607.1 hypothetical protein [Kineosporia mesophila]